MAACVPKAGKGQSLPAARHLASVTVTVPSETPVTSRTAQEKKTAAAEVRLSHVRNFSKHGGHGKQQKNIFVIPRLRKEIKELCYGYCTTLIITLIQCPWQFIMSMSRRGGPIMIKGKDFTEILWKFQKKYE